MPGSRDIHDFCMLATVRQRRGVALEKQMQAARHAHADCLAQHARAQDLVHGCKDALHAYRLALTERTTAGQGVNLDQLQAARAHCVTLQETCAEAEKSVITTGHAASAALSVVADLVRQIATNDVRIDSLMQEVKRCETALAVAAEDREEDERPERKLFAHVGVGAAGARPN